MVLKPLKGARVLDFSRLVPGPFCTLILADLGAEVIKIEDIEMGDYTRFMPPMATSTKSVLYEILNRDKKSLSLNLKSEQGRAVIGRLIGHCEIVVESFRPGVADKLGIGCEYLSRLNPKLIYCSITGYGQKTTRAAKAGHDLNYLGLSGFIDNNKLKDTPTLPGTQLADLVSGGFCAVISILAAYIEQITKRKGVHLDISMTHGFVSLLPILFASRQAREPQDAVFRDFLFGDNPQYGIYRTKDNKFLTLAAIEPKFWVNFCIATGHPELVESNIMSDEGKLTLRNNLNGYFSEKTQDEHLDILKKADCCVEPVYGVEEALARLNEDHYRIARTEQLEDRDFTYLYSLPFLFHNSEKDVHFSPAPGQGEHSTTILRDIAGMNSTEIDRLIADKTIGGK